jgi:RHS repeat-associated protein
LRRDATDWSALGSPFAGSHETERGYTGHEHLDTVGLIHMNGRVQDPVLGRFISADPLIQAPYSTQSHNRYSYVWNNPVSLTDPSGFCTAEMGWKGCMADAYTQFTDELMYLQSLEQYIDGYGYIDTGLAQAMAHFAFGDDFHWISTMAVLGFFETGAEVPKSNQFMGQQRNSDAPSPQPPSTGRPDFDRMSDRQLTNWIVQQRNEFGIELRDGVMVTAIDEYRRWESGVGWLSCSDALCGGLLEGKIYGHYDPSRNAIELFKPAFEAGFHSFALSPERILGANLSRAAIAVQSLGHEAAHSMGVDMVRGLAPTHYGAENAGLEAMRAFRRIYEP